MTVHEKHVTRYEAVCDYCGEYLGECSSSGDAWALIHRHVLNARDRRDDHEAESS